MTPRRVAKAGFPALLAVLVPLGAALAQSDQKSTSGDSSFSRAGEEIKDGAQRFGEGVKEGAIGVWEAIKSGARAASDKLSGHDSTAKPSPPANGTQSNH